MECAPSFRTVNLQGWHDLTFLHWSYPPAVVQRLLPSGLEVDTAEGLAWVGITPFRMHAVRPAGLPPLPHLSFFPEVNCRTYVRHANGTRGIWFFSLDTPRLWIVAALRALGLPYRWAAADVVTDPGGPAVARRLSYRSRRRGPGGPARLRADVEVGTLLDHPDALAVSLTARWWAFTRRAGRIWQVPVAHPDWPLYTARAVALDAGELLAAAGLPPSADDALVHFSPGVRTRLGLPRPS